MYSITFGNIDSYEDWGLMLTNYVNTPPEGKRNIVEVPFRDGVLDITSVLTPTMRFTTRTLEFTFECEEEPEDFQAIVDQVMDDVHGKTLDVVVGVDPDYHWDCYCEVSEKGLERHHGAIVITCIAQPYKLKAQPTVLTQSGSGTLTCPNEQRPVTPEFNSTAEAQITFDGTTYAIGTGTTTVSNIIFQPGDNELQITTTGTVTVTYTEGRL